MKSSIAAFCLFAALAIPVRADHGFTQDVTWRIAGTSDPIARAVYVMRSGNDDQASRLLVVTPEGRHIVLTNRLRASGVMTMTLRDETSGWTVTYTQNFGVKRATLQELFRAVDPENLDDDAQVTLTLESSGGTAFTATVPFGQTHDQEFATVLMDSKASEQLRTAVPTEVRHELPFLDMALIDDVQGGSFRALVEILRAVLDDEASVPAVKADLGRRIRGWNLSSSDQMALVAGFPSVSISNPLADR